MKKHLAVILLGILVITLGAGIALAGTPKGSSANYAIPWDVVAAGGGEMASTNYALKGTVGQGAIGPGSSSSYTIGAGYWYGLGEQSLQVFLPFINKPLPP